MERIAYIYETGDLNKYRFKINWNSKFGTWSFRNISAGKYYSCRLIDEDGNVLAALEYDFLKSIILPHVNIIIGNKKVMQVSKSLSFDYGFSVSGADYRIEAIGLREKWILSKSGEKIAEIITKEYEVNKSCYKVVTDDDNAVLGVCVCMAIDIAIQIMARLIHQKS